MYILSSIITYVISSDCYVYSTQIKHNEVVRFVLNATAVDRFIFFFLLFLAPIVLRRDEVRARTRSMRPIRKRQVATNLKRKNNFGLNSAFFWKSNTNTHTLGLLPALSHESIGRLFIFTELQLFRIVFMYSRYYRTLVFLIPSQWRWGNFSKGIKRN